MSSVSGKSHHSRSSSRASSANNPSDTEDRLAHSSDESEGEVRGNARSPPRSPRRQSEARSRQVALPSRLISSAGGRYIPPAAKRRMLAEAAGANKESDETMQRENWELLKKRINGPINKVNTANIKDIVVELFSANLIRGRGLLCRSVMRAQSLSSSFTPVYAALVAVINTKLPVVGDLLVTRLVLQFRRAFNRDDKERCISTAMFLAHLTNQRVAHEVLAFQLVSLLLETPTDDSVEVAVSFMREVGAFLLDAAPRVLNAVFDTFRSILHEADIDKRVQYMIEVLFQVRRDGFKNSPIIPEGLDLVEEDEQIVHEVALDDDDLEAQDELNVFAADNDFAENEQKYNAVKSEILGESEDSESGHGSESDSGSDSGSESESGTEGDSESEESDGGNDETVSKTESTGVPGMQKIHDLTETELVTLRRTIYLAVMSSLSFEEASHKLLQIKINPGEEQEMCNMVIECCSQERTYKAFYGLIGERLCKLNRTWANGFRLAFGSCYENIHRYETNHLRNIAHFFAHLLFSNALHWSVLQAVVLTEEATTSSSRIFLKILLQDLSEELGLQKLNERLKSDDPGVSEALKGMFPNSDPKAIRFAINYYTSIGMGAITEEMREWLKTAQATAALKHNDSDSDSDSGSGSDSGSDSDTSSGSESSSGSYTSSDTGSGTGSGTGSDSGSHSDSDSDSYGLSVLRSSRPRSKSKPRSISNTKADHGRGVDGSTRNRSPDPSPSRKDSPKRETKLAKDILETEDQEGAYKRQPSKPIPESAEPRDSGVAGQQPSTRRARSPSYSPQTRSTEDQRHLPTPRSPPSQKRRRHSKSPASGSDAEHGTKAMRDLSLDNSRETKRDSRSDISHQRRRSGSRDRAGSSSRAEPRQRSRQRHSRDNDYHRSDSRRYYRDRSYSRSRSPARRDHRRSYSSRSDSRRRR
ncbi:pre-mRNA-splicing factor cwc22 [Coemansia sp. RSA 1286]|nr:pre-mRNA-splicing factor cwc22 [Coemansia sp. RSA 485]KAJ2602232.1 pre-mRNA-splicing factor cwc22 [Coemansia sp. RSA 1721]KAJ2639418.1 pre-mRNA-splicing factor cwc22 [Coemansia sp. RSA 1286]